MFDYPEKRALIVDDDEYYQESIGSVLRSEGVDCSRLYTGENALIFLETISFRLLIIEEHLPGVSGLEVAAVARGLQPSVPIIITTVAATPQGIREAALLGVYEYAAKPLDSTWIRSKIAQALVKSFVPPKPKKKIGTGRSTMPAIPDLMFLKKSPLKIILVESDDRVRAKIIAATIKLGCNVSAFKTVDRAIAQSRISGFDVLIARPQVIGGSTLWASASQTHPPLGAVTIVDEMYREVENAKVHARAKGNIYANAEVGAVSSKLRLILSQLITG